MISIKIKIRNIVLNEIMLVDFTKINKEKTMMKINNILLLLLAVLTFSCTPGGSTLLSMTKFAGAPIPDVVEITSAAISIPLGMKEIYNNHQAKTAKNSREKLVYCLVEINRDKAEDEKLELSKEEIDLLIVGMKINIKDDPRREAVTICMNDER